MASLPRWVHGVQDARCLALRAGDGTGVVVDGEVGAGVAVACPGLRGGVCQQRSDQRDAPGGQRRDHYRGAEVAGIEIMPSGSQVLPGQVVMDGAGHLVVGHGGIGGGHAGDQVRERDLRAALVMLPAVCAGPARFVTAGGLALAVRAAAAGRGIVAGLGDVQLVAQPEFLPLDAPPGVGVIR